MNVDWLTTLLPLVNATGIPLLAIGIILLLRAYQKSVETYRETSDHLREENERIRKRLVEADTFYFSEVEKMRATVSDSVNTIKELQVRKISLLARADENTKEAVLSDVEKIDEAIGELKKISAKAKYLDIQVREVLFSINQDFQELTTHVSELADQISDTKSRVTLVGVVTSNTAYKELMSEIKKSKGLIAPPSEKNKVPKLASHPPESLMPPLTPKLPFGNEDLIPGAIPEDEDEKPFGDEQGMPDWLRGLGNNKDEISSDDEQR